jgi:1-acyl-sn-glycerol-3-phosphate acyltransferase
VQREKLEGKSEFSLGIFPEGTTTNGQVLLKFKPGAFMSKTPVKAYLFKVSSKYVRPTYDCVGFGELLTLLFCQWSCKITAYEFPVFSPNKWLFENRKDLGNDEVSIFAEAVRRSMAKVGDMKLLDGVDFSNNIEFDKYL